MGFVCKYCDQMIQLTRFCENIAHTFRSTSFSAHYNVVSCNSSTFVSAIFKISWVFSAYLRNLRVKFAFYLWLKMNRCYQKWMATRNAVRLIVFTVICCVVVVSYITVKKIQSIFTFSFTKNTIKWQFRFIEICRIQLCHGNSSRIWVFQRTPIV